MINPETNHVVSSPSSEHDTPLYACARRNEQEHHTSPNDQARVRAYERYIERGKQPSDLRDWLEAEREYQEQL